MHVTIRFVLGGVEEMRFEAGGPDRRALGEHHSRVNFSALPVVEDVGIDCQLYQIAGNLVATEPTLVSHSVLQGAYCFNGEADEKACKVTRHNPLGESPHRRIRMPENSSHHTVDCSEQSPAEQNHQQVEFTPSLFDGWAALQPAIENANRLSHLRSRSLDLSIIPTAIVCRIAVIRVRQFHLNAKVTGGCGRPPRRRNLGDPWPHRNIGHQRCDRMPDLCTGSELYPANHDQCPVGWFLARAVVDSDFNRVLGVGHKIIGVLLDAASKQRDIRIVPRHRLAELHQHELTIDARVGPIDNALWKVEAWVSSFRTLAEEDVQLA